jgi:hypothetical protein
MAHHAHVGRVQVLVSEIARQNLVIRDIITRSLEVLKTPQPDTFLGRKTQEPFPKQDEGKA